MPDLTSVLRDLHIPEFVARSREIAIASDVAEWATDDTSQAEPNRLARIALIYERQGIVSFSRWIGTQDPTDRDITRGQFMSAFSCWEALHSHLSTLEATEAMDDYFPPELRDLSVTPSMSLAFHYAICGILADRTAETRLGLRTMPLPTEIPEDWPSRVIHHVLSALIMLTRKANGWDDIDVALASIEALRDLQSEYEDAYVESVGDANDQAVAALHLVGLYHLAQMMTITGEYLRDGEPTIAQVNGRLDGHRERSTNAFELLGMTLERHSAELLWIGCRALAGNTIWTHVAGLGQRVQEFARTLAARGRPQPIIELWPSQQQALADRLLDTYPRAILVEMPTSAGKTLLAKFVIVQAKALNPDATIMYIVPTRALVNQLTLDLRADLRALGLVVEQAVPAFELDPTENELLQGRIDVLVTTPEKLDLLVRSGHPVAANIALVIADEAHNLRDGGRGARLELLLGTVKRDKPEARFLLLSPFLPNSDELVRWLGDARSHAIGVQWNASRKMVGTVSVSGRRARRAVKFETLAAAANSDIREGISIPIGSAQGEAATSKSRITQLAVKSLLDEGSVLVLCAGQGTSINRASELKDQLPEIAMTPSIEAVIAYLTAEVGHEPILAQCLRHGVAYHHAGLSPEARWLIEGLIRDNSVQVICGTTTLAQGVNFPIKTVIVETLKKGDAALEFQDFWNIAGRAGRAMVDSIGLVAFPARNAKDRANYQAFLRAEAREISSQLAILLENTEEIAERFDMATLRRQPELSALLQFLAHAMRVSGTDAIADNVEDLLRASLVYHQARAQGEDVARRLVELCRAYVEETRRRQNLAGLLTLADQTGFATPSVLQLLRNLSDVPALRLTNDWHPSRLFGEDVHPLLARIEAIAALPEISLGQAAHEPFNARLVAEILRSWVQGKSLGEMAQLYRVNQEDEDDEKRLAGFSRYLFSQLLGRASWGIGALEGVCLAGQENIDPAIGYVPSMIFFGVKEREAVWLRSVGVPRIVADPLARMWRTRDEGDPGTYAAIRQWVSDLGDDDWAAALPEGSPLTPQHMRSIWESFSV